MKRLKHHVVQGSARWLVSLTTTSLLMIPMPAVAQEPTTASQSTAVTPGKQARSSRGPNYRLAGGIGSATAGVGFLALFGVAYAKSISLQNDPGFENYRSGFTYEQDVCEQAQQWVEVDHVAGAATAAQVQAHCASARTFETLQAVSLPFGVVLAGLGTYLILTSSSPTNETEVRAKAWSVSPHLGRNAGGATIQLRF